MESDFMPIKWIAADCDDTIEPHVDSGSRDLSNSRASRNFLNRYPNIRFSVVTGQSVAATRDVVEALDREGPHVYEMGYLWCKHGAEPSLLPANQTPEIVAVEDMRQRLLKGDVATYCEKYGVDADIIRAKQKMLSFQIGKQNGGDFGRDVLPHMINDYGGDEFRRLYDGDMINLLNPGYAADIIPAGVSKGVALRRLQKVFRIHPGNTLVVVDSDHSDLPMLEYAISGYAACPANASAEIIDRVSRKGNKGYVSGRKCRDGGFLDILEYAERTWGFTS